MKWLDGACVTVLILELSYVQTNESSAANAVGCSVLRISCLLQSINSANWALSTYSIR